MFPGVLALILRPTSRKICSHGICVIWIIQDFLAGGTRSLHTGDVDEDVPRARSTILLFLQGFVLCFWGDARWSRAQLLGEIAHGSWGLGRATVGDLAAPPAKRWKGTEERLAFAPETEMTEDYMKVRGRSRNREDTGLL